MNWEKRAGELILNVEIGMFFGTGNYEIHCVKRPSYCDRGDWNILVFGKNDLDDQDGFPRYFCGSEEEVQTQMERWLLKREAFTKMKGKT